MRRVQQRLSENRWVVAAAANPASCPLLQLSIYSDADINDLTVGSIAADLARERLGPAGLGVAAVATPTFPLQGMLWWVHKRPLFSMTGI